MIATATLQDQQSSGIYCQFPTFSGHMCFREKHEKNSHHLHHRTHFLPTVSHDEFKDYVSFSSGEGSAAKLGPEQPWGGVGSHPVGRVSLLHKQTLCSEC